MDTDTNRADIENKMKLTFKERRNIMDIQKYLTNALLKAFPKLKSFQGSMIDLEFNLIHEGKEHNFLMNWRDVSQKIVAISRGNKKLESCLHFKDDALNAMCVLTKYLPRAMRVYQWENKMNPDPAIDDFVQVEPVGTNIQNAIETKRERAKFPIQPYLLAIGDTDNIHTWCLVLGDSHWTSTNNRGNKSC